jgi:hypothetical protein
MLLAVLLATIVAPVVCLIHSARRAPKSHART